jgi:hypothetical protein
VQDFAKGSGALWKAVIGPIQILVMLDLSSFVLSSEDHHK